MLLSQIQVLVAVIYLVSFFYLCSIVDQLGIDHINFYLGQNLLK